MRLNGAIRPEWRGGDSHKAKWRVREQRCYRPLRASLSLIVSNVRTAASAEM